MLVRYPVRASSRACELTECDSCCHAVREPGRPTFNLVGNNSCWYTDMTGSGNETLSHLYEPGNGRITVMFSACSSAPLLNTQERLS